MLYTGPTPWGSATALAELIEGPAEFEAFAPTWRPLFWNLSERTAEELLANADFWMRALAVIRADEAPTAEFRRICLEALRRLGGLADQNVVRWAELVSMVVHWVAHRRPRSEHDEVFAAVPSTQPEPLQGRIQSMMKTAADSFREEGELRALRATLRRLLTRRFGQVPERLAQQLDATTDRERLAGAIDRVFDVANATEIEL